MKFSSFFRKVGVFIASLCALIIFYCINNSEYLIKHQKKIDSLSVYYGFELFVFIGLIKMLLLTFGIVTPIFLIILFVRNKILK